MTNSPLDTRLWTPRSIKDTQALYASWADQYDADMARLAYATPGRIAAALVQVGAETSQPVLDFGCGTGLSGAALRAAGFASIDGTDISAEMLDHARGKAIYRDLMLGTPGEGPPGTYATIVATGVVSLGAAPPEMLSVLLDALAPAGLLAFSYNDPTLGDHNYIDALQGVLDSATATQVFREHGAHLNETVTGSDVIVLRRAAAKD